MNNIIINILHKIATKLNPDKKPCSATTPNIADLGKQKSERFPETIANDRKLAERERNRKFGCVGMVSKRVPTAAPPFRVFGQHHSLSSSFVPSFSRPETCPAMAHGIYVMVCVLVGMVLLSSCIGSKSTIDERFSESVCNDYKVSGSGSHVSNTYTNYKDSMSNWSSIDIESIINGRTSIIYNEVEESSTDSAGIQHNYRWRSIDVSRDIESKNTTKAIDSSHVQMSGQAIGRDSTEISTSTSANSSTTISSDRHKESEIETKSLTESILPRDFGIALLVISILLWLIIRRDSGNPFADL